MSDKGYGILRGWGRTGAWAAVILITGAAWGAVPESGEFQRIVTEAKSRVFPAVVYIKCIVEDHASGKKESRQVSGSGVIISEDGEVLSNWHVVDKAAQVRCLLSDGRHFATEIVGMDKDTDLSLLKLKLPAGEKAPCATLGDSSKLKEGDFVMAMGAPWGLSRSVTIGIVSCKDRYLPENGEYSLWLQSDASISPGNSGGPLIDTRGEIVGINTLGIRSGGDMAFSIPVTTIRYVAGQLRQHGRVKWGWLGLELQPLRDFEKDIYFDGNDGMIVAQTEPHSPAEQAGILPQDRIVRINGQAVTAATAEDLPAVRTLLGTLPVGQEARFTIRRNGAEIEIAAIPQEKGSVQGDELECPRWDFTVKAINRFESPKQFFNRSRGVYVFGIKQPGNGSKAGIQEGDIILKIDNREIQTLDDLRAIHKEMLANIGQKSKAGVAVLRNGLLRQVVLDFSRDYERE